LKSLIVEGLKDTLKLTMHVKKLMEKYNIPVSSVVNFEPDITWSLILTAIFGTYSKRKMPVLIKALPT